MANTELKRMPRGQISMGGDLHQVREGEYSYANNATLHYTLRGEGKPTGVSKGNEAVTGSLTALIDEDDTERDYVGDAKKLKAKTFQYKSPKVTYVIDGVISNVTVRFPDGGPIEMVIQFTGLLVD